MKRSKLFNYLIFAGLFSAMGITPNIIFPGREINFKNYVHLKTIDNTIQDGLTTRLFFPTSTKELLK